MNEVVVDASAALRTLSAHEEGHAEAAELFGKLLPLGIEPIAPDIFPYEVGNALRKSKGAAPVRTSLFLDALQLVRIVPSGIDVLARAFGSASKLSFYDACYVELAETREALLWTQDDAILKAAPEIAFDTTRLRSRLRL